MKSEQADRLKAVSQTYSLTAYSLNNLRRSHHE